MNKGLLILIRRKLMAGFLAATVLVTPLLLGSATPQAYAANFTAMSVTLSSNLNSATNVTWTNNFTTATTGTIASVELTFATGVNVSAATLGTVTGLSAGSIAVSGQKVTYTVTTPASISSGTAISIPLNAVDNPSTIGNYSVGFVSKNASGTRIDQGATLAYLDADGVATGITDNQVTVTADVSPIIDLAIFSDANLTTGTNSCALGTLSVASVSNCVYYLRVGTNANSGYTLKVIADAKLNNAGNTADIDDVADGTVTAGSEEYGFGITAGTGSTSLISADTAVPTSTTNAMTSAGPIAAGTTTKATVTHKASITTATPSEVYDQIVTYTMFSN